MRTESSALTSFAPSCNVFGVHDWNEQAGKLNDHFFRHESAKLVAALTRFFGPKHIDLAEDVTQAALIEALEAWRFGKIPQNPSGWLFRVAKNRALDALRHQKVKARREPGDEQADR